MRELRLPILMHRIPFEVAHADIVRVVIRRAVGKHGATDGEHVIELDQRNVRLWDGDDATRSLRTSEYPIADP